MIVRDTNEMQPDKTAYIGVLLTYKHIPLTVAVAAVWMEVLNETDGTGTRNAVVLRKRLTDGFYVLQNDILKSIFTRGNVYSVMFSSRGTDIDCIFAKWKAVGVSQADDIVNTLDAAIQKINKKVNDLLEKIPEEINKLLKEAENEAESKRDYAARSERVRRIGDGEIPF